MRTLDATGILMTENTKEGKIEGAVSRIHRVNNSKIMGLDEYCIGSFGDIRYNSPEVVAGKAYDFKADSWSFGIILFYMLTCVLPFDHLKNMTT